MAVHRGLQSMIFWYASCAPCTERKYKKQRLRDIEQGRIDREILASQIPNMYRHPDPTDTNPNWHHEIETGPAFVGRRWKGYSEDPRKKGSRGNRSTGSNPGSPELRPAVESRDGFNDSKLDFKKYQRDDDELWGNSSTERLGFPRGWQAEGVTVPPRAHTLGSDASSRNPPLNDLHPATVTKIHSREDARWIFQPLPTADVMLGKTRAPRSRSDSGNSSRPSARSSVPLSRDLSSRLVEQKLRNHAGSLTSTMSRGSSGLNAEEAREMEVDRSATAEIDFAAVDDALNQQRAHSMPPALDISEDSNESAVTVLRTPHTPSEESGHSTTRTVASRPQLSTIASDDDDGTLPDHLPLPKENGAPRPISTSDNLTAAERDRVNRRSALIAKDDSLRVLQELAPSSRIFKTQVISPNELVIRASKKSGPRQPSQDAAKDRTTFMPADIDPEIFEAWDTADFELPEWIHEHTKREVKERWSMDI